MLNDNNPCENELVADANSISRPVHGWEHSPVSAERMIHNIVPADVTSS